MDTVEDTFVAEENGPPKRRFWIARDPKGQGGPNVVRGWCFVYDQFDNGEWMPGGDTWEEWFFEILRYPQEYAHAALIWRRQSNNEVVDLASLQPLYDGKVVGADETPDSAGLASP
jgi:hypothetical protein